MQYQLVEYTDARGERFEAVQVPWSEVERTGGYDPTPDGDRGLVALLLIAGAPSWVQTARGWTDEAGWGLIGPRKPD
jgi:hypothetical protein